MDKEEELILYWTFMQGMFCELPSCLFHLNLDCVRIEEYNEVYVELVDSKLKEYFFVNKEQALKRLIKEKYERIT